MASPTIQEALGKIKSYASTMPSELGPPKPPGWTDNIKNGARMSNMRSFIKKNATQIGGLVGK